MLRSIWQDLLKINYFMVNPDNYVPSLKRQTPESLLAITNELIAELQPNTEWVCVCGYHNQGPICTKCGEGRPLN